MSSFVTGEFFASQIRKSQNILVGGFGCCGAPEDLLKAIRERFETTQEHLDLGIFFVSSVGDMQGAGIDNLAVNGLVKFAIGGFWGFTPNLSKMALDGLIKAHNWPLGVVKHWINSIAHGADGFKTEVGFGTFIDPEYDGGVLNRKTKTLLKVHDFLGKKYIYYPAQRIDWALLRGSYADRNGNISIDKELLHGSCMSDALSAKRFGGKVVVQVEKIVDTIPPKQVQIPGLVVDYIVVSQNPKINHKPSYGSSNINRSSQSPIPERRLALAKKAANEIGKEDRILNFGIGVPALVPRFLNCKNGHNLPITIESGVIGGVPYDALSFGGAENPEAIVDPTHVFNMYQGMGIDACVLGFAEIDNHCRVNVSKFQNTLRGSGGFIDIVSASKKVVLCGFSKSSTGKSKFVKEVEHITVDFSHPRFASKEVIIVTEEDKYRIFNGKLKTIKRDI
ncbi:hypothetical protein A9G07_07235 [Gilliamella sp. wkB72]|uniref:CoA-transferase n=1 Tax=Gilliamella sp. wkB72 TaxID=3120265 RepID=UPI000810A02E|nr:CoA-transferase [Gilliamella apicola]OCL22853.1 hypothetical protein A9G07_07235 [Gilliamella apicola]